MKKAFIFAGIAFFAFAFTKSGYEIGDTAADFALKNTDGKMVSLSDFTAASGFIIIFDCNTCPYSKIYNSRIADLNTHFAPLGFPVIAINANDGAGDTFEDMVRIAKKKNLQYPYLFDESQHVAKSFGATNTPHVFVLTKSRKVAYIGAIDDNARQEEEVTKHYVAEAVTALLNNTSIAVEKTKAIGCGIKWKD